MKDSFVMPGHNGPTTLERGTGGLGLPPSSLGHHLHLSQTLGQTKLSDIQLLQEPEIFLILVMLVN